MFSFLKLGNKAIHSQPDEYKRIDYSDSGEAWVHQKQNPVAVVFVPGWSGHFQKTWTWKTFRKSVYLLRDLLAKDVTLRSHCDFYAFNHGGGPFDVTGVTDASLALRTFIAANVLKREGGGWPNRPVVLVSHSMGGLICRQAIIDYLETPSDGKPAVIGLLTYGSPNLGTEVARLAKRWSKSAGNLAPWNDFLDKLNRCWLRHVVNGGEPDLEFARRARIRCRVVYGLKDRVVEAASVKAMSHLGQLAALPKGHTSLPKAQSSTDGTFTELKDFVLECIKGWKQDPLSRSIDLLAHQVRWTLRNQHHHDGVPWTKREEDTIELAALPGGQADQLKCTIKSERWAGAPQAQFWVCLSLPGREPPGVTPDYICFLGQGLLSEKDYVTFKDRLETASLNDADFQKLLSVDSIGFRDLNTGERLKYIQTDFSGGPGYALCRYDLQSDFPGVLDRNNKFELTISTYGSRKHGWYSYCARRTIVDGLDLELLAPFEIRCHASLWWCKFEKPEVLQLTTSRFSSRISIPGPVPVGTIVTWTFHQ